MVTFYTNSNSQNVYQSLKNDNPTNKSFNRHLNKELPVM